MAKRKITITVSEEMYNQLDDVAAKMGITKNSLCTTYVSQCLYNTNTVQDLVKEMMQKYIADFESKAL